MNENPFHSFTVADQVFLWHLPVIHDVNGSYQSLNTSLFGFSWIWVESMQTPDGLQLDDPEIYRFGCIPGGVQLEYVGECKVHPEAMIPAWIKHIRNLLRIVAYL